MQRVTQNVWAETGWPGCNVGFVTTSDGVVLVDSPQRPTDAVEWLREAQSKGPLRYLINTEYHGDHTTGNFFFPITVVAQEGAREAFLTSTGSVEQLKERVKVMDPEGVALLDGYEPRAPTITYSDRLTLHVGDHTFKLLNLPGHTVSETAVYVPEEKVVFTGDNVIHRIHPFLQDAVPFRWLESLKVLRAMEIDFVVPGHGEVCDKSGLSEMAAGLEYVIETVRKALVSGMSKDEAAETISFDDHFAIDPTLVSALERLRRVNVIRVYEALEAQLRGTP